MEMEKVEWLIDMKEEEEKNVANTKVQGSLKKEILHLEKRLKDQLAVRHALEKALGYRTTGIISSSNDNFIPKSAKELISEITVLELEVMHLEQYLLSLYRKAFDPKMPPEERSKELISCQRMLFQAPKPGFSSKNNPTINSTRILPSQMSSNKLIDESYCENLADLKCRRSHSALNHRAVYSSRISPSQEPLAAAFQECQSQPVQFLKNGHVANSCIISLAEYLGTNIADHVPETPNKISEDMVRCMGAIYSKLSDPPLVNINHGSTSSSSSSSFSLNATSSHFVGDTCGPRCKNESILDTRLTNPFRNEVMKESSCPYNAMVEVSSICTDSERLKIVDVFLSTYKSLVEKLATVDVKKMNNDEKIAFWINLHNALMMHTYLVHGVPQNSIKMASLFSKATCSVGGVSIDAKIIQTSLLGCCTHFYGQWLQTLKHQRIKFKCRDEERRRFCAIDRKEPLLHFALCYGSHSDPAVRVYSAKRLYQQLETAKEEYIRATVCVQRENKILLPKLIEYYSKNICMNSHNVVDLIQNHFLPEAIKLTVQRKFQKKKNKIEWVPHNFSFRYLLSREVACSQLL